MNRRELLQSTAALAVVAATPPALKPIAAKAAAPLTPMWAVGTDYGDMDWQPIGASTCEEARRLYAMERGLTAGEADCDGTCHDMGGFPESGACRWCGCEDVNEPSNCIDAVRVDAWDGKEKIRSVDWIAANMGSQCDRCGDDCFGGQDARAVGDEAVCDECMTLADWQIVDPHYAAELMADPA